MEPTQYSLEEIMAMGEDEVLQETEGYGDESFDGEYIEENLINDPNEPTLIKPDPIVNPTDAEEVEEVIPVEEAPPATKIPPKVEPKAPPSEETTEVKPTEDEVALKDMLEKNYSLLSSQGVLDVNDDFEFDGTSGSLKAALEQTKENIHKSVSDNIWELLPEIIAGREDDYLTNLDNVDLSNEDTQRQVVYNDLKINTKFGEDRIKQLVDRTADMGMLAEEAQGSLVRLKEYQENLRQEAAQQALNTAKEREQEFVTRRNTIQSAIKDSSAIHGKRKNKVEAFMFNSIKRGEDVDTDYHRKLKVIANNPQFEVELANFIYDFDEEKGFDYSRVSKKKTSTQVDAFEQQLNTIFSIKDKVTGKPPTTSGDDFNFEMWHNQHDGEIYN